MKILFYLNVFLFSCLLIGCNGGKNRDTTGNDKIESANVVNCKISGDRGGTYKEVGSNASIAFIGFQDGVFKGLCILFRNDEGVAMNTGMVNLNPNLMSEQEGATTGYVDFNPDSDDWEDHFNSQHYIVFYDTNTDFRDSKTYVKLTKAEKIKDGYMHLEGNFKFNAANNPGYENLSSACKEEALKSSPRQPAYLASLAGTSQINVSGDFSIDVLVKPFGW